MGFHRVGRNVQARGNFLVNEAVGEEAQNLRFPRAEAGRAPGIRIAIEGRAPAQVPRSRKPLEIRKVCNSPGTVRAKRKSSGQVIARALPASRAPQHRYGRAALNPPARRRVAGRVFSIFPSRRLSGV